MSIYPKFLWDIGYLDSLKDELGDERKLLCLSPLSFRLLADMSAMLLWPTRFGLSRGDPIPEFIQDCYGELNNPQDIVGCLGADNLEDLIVNSEDIMIQITNNVDCCCGASSSPTTIFCVGQDGSITYTPQTPVDPTPKPPDGLVFPLDPEVDPVPGDFSDWTEYDAGFCAFSNGLWQAARAVIVVTETVIDVLAAGAALAVVLAPLLPAGVLAAIGGITFLEVVWELVKIITSEQASDILNEIVDWLDAEKEAIVCTIYSHRYDWGGLGLGLAESASDYIELTLTLSADERNAVQNVVAKLFFWQVAAGYVAGELGVFTSDSPIDCSLCGAVTGFTWSVPEPGTWCTSDPVLLAVSGGDTGQSITYAGSNSKGSEYGSYEQLIHAYPVAPLTTIPEFSNKVLRFTNVIQNQSITIDLTITYGAGQSLSAAIAPGAYHDFDLSSIADVTSVELKVILGIYNAPCPQPVSGQFSWAVV